jgi:hypothetical protein
MRTVTATSAAPQHAYALARANRVRVARAVLKRQVAAGQISAAEVIQARPWEAATMLVSELLLSQHRWGEARTRRLLIALTLPEAKRIDTLTDRQAGQLAAALSPRAP